MQSVFAAEFALIFFKLKKKNENRLRKCKKHYNIIMHLHSTYSTYNVIHCRIYLKVSEVYTIDIDNKTWFAYLMS